MVVLLLLLQSSLGFQYSYFTSQFFSTLEGWSMYSANQVGSQIGVYDSYSYLGLDYLMQGNIYIILYDLPPHQYLRIRAKMLMKSPRPLYAQLIWLVDHEKVSQFQTVEEQNVHKQELDSTFSHNANSIVIRYCQVQYEHLITSGIRDVYLDFTSCPDGCLKCEPHQTQLTCLQYKIIDYDLSSSQLSNFNNDGWYFQDANKIFSIFQCEEELKLNFFGIFTKSDVVTKIFVLPPHYFLQIEALFIYLRQRVIQTLNTQFVLDGTLVDSNNIGFQRAFQSLCNYDENWQSFDTHEDGLERYKFNFQHSKRIMNITIYNQQLDDNNVLWGFRDFQIFYKACHSSCISGCKGPYTTDCIDNKFSLTPLSENFFDLSLSNFDGWASAMPYTITSICNNFQLLGGYGFLQGNQQLTQIIYRISSHTTLSLSLTLYQIDLFDVNDKFFIFINEIEVYQKTFAQLTSETGNKKCGALSLDAIYDIKLTQIPHKASFAIIKFLTSQTSVNGYWGIRNIKINYDQYFPLSEQLTQQKGYTVQNFSMISSTPIISSCINGNYDFIGYFSQGQNFRKQISNIPTHPQLLITWKIIIAYTQLSTSAKSLWITLDGRIVWQQNFKMNSGNKACDNLSYSTIYKFQIIVDHQFPEALIEIYSNFENDQQWGIREFKIELLDTTL